MDLFKKSLTLVSLIKERRLDVWGSCKLFPAFNDHLFIV